jgi:hypothetical protein
MVAATGADELKHAGIAAVEAAVHDAAGWRRTNAVLP